MISNEQSFRLKLEAKGVQADVAREAAALLAKYRYGNVYSAADKMLVEDFARLYRLDSVNALEILKSKLID